MPAVATPRSSNGGSRLPDRQDLPVQVTKPNGVNYASGTFAAICTHPESTRHRRLTPGPRPVMSLSTLCLPGTHNDPAPATLKLGIIIGRTKNLERFPLRRRRRQSAESVINRWA